MSLSTEDRALLIAAIAPRIPRVVERSVQRAKAALEAYAMVDERELADGIIADLQRAMTALLEDRELTDEDRAGMGAIGDTRARQGIPLEAMLQVYRFTIDEVFGGLWEATEEGAIDHAAVVRLTRKIWQYADPMMDVAIQAYRRRELDLAVAEGQDRTALVHELLLGAPGARHDEIALAAGLDPAADYVALRARTAGQQRTLLLDLATHGVLEHGAVAPHEGDVIGFARRAPAAAPADALVGVGPPGPLAALPHSLAVATRALETAAAFDRRGTVTIDAVALPAIARSETTIGRHLDARFVAPCTELGPPGEELLDTVRALLDWDLSVERAAEHLYVHPNTVRNRLRRYEQLTSSSLRHIDDLCGLRLALLRTELRPAGVGGLPAASPRPQPDATSRGAGERRAAGGGR